MAMTDPISDYLTRIRNGIQARHKFVDIPASRVKAELSKILADAGYISDTKFVDEGVQGRLRVYLKYGHDAASAIKGIKRISKPSLRVYASSNQIPRVLGGYGMSILSTSQGILPDVECRKRHIGGEVMCEVW